MLSATNPDIKNATVVVESIDTRVLHIKITDANSYRFEPPMFNTEWLKEFTPVNVESMGLSMTNTPFAFTITYPITRDQIVTTQYTETELKYQEKFLTFYHKVNSQKIFGLGEHFGYAKEEKSVSIQCEIRIAHARFHMAMEESTAMELSHST